MDRVPGVPADGEPDHGERVLQRAWDEDGNYYEIWQFGSSYGYWDETAQARGGGPVVYRGLPLAGLAGDTAYLDPCYNRMAAVDAAVPIQ